MKNFLAVFFLFLAAGPALAAPMWIERQAAPKAKLLDPALAQEDASSAVAIDHSAWSRFLESYVVAGSDGINRVRYQSVSAGDRAALLNYISALEAVDVARLARREQIAFWINLYNAATVRLILDNEGVASIRKIARPWDSPVVSVAGRQLTLNEIEHGVLRPIAQDPRIHYAVNCASIGCPNLTPAAFTGAELEAELDAAARAYVNHPRGVSVEGGKLIVSKIYGWYADDFGGTDAAVIAHARRFAGPALDEKLATIRAISGYRYDWSLNAAP
jgi:hypothetical protein